MVRVQCPECSYDLYVDAPPEAGVALCVCGNLLRIVYKDYRINISSLCCPHCDSRGPFSKVPIDYSDGADRYRCRACAKYFKGTDELPVSSVEDNTHRTQGWQVSPTLLRKGAEEVEAMERLSERVRPYRYRSTL
jgi:hypothetical protein